MSPPADPPIDAKPVSRNREKIGHGWEIEVKAEGDLRLLTMDSAPFRGANLTFRKARTVERVRMLLAVDPAAAAQLAVSLRGFASERGLIQSAFLIRETAGRRVRIGPMMELGRGRDAAPDEVRGSLESGLGELDAGDLLYFCIELSPQRGFVAIVDLSIARDLAGTEADSIRGEKRIEAIARLDESAPSPYYAVLKTLAAAAGAAAVLPEIDRLIDLDLRLRGRRFRLNGPLVSVVMPVFDRAGIVGEAIGSALAQSWRPLELIVCDDGSADDTAAVVSSFRDSRLILIRHGARKGAAAARNTALSRAGGKYVAYLDSDNLWHPRFLEAAVDALEANEGRTACFAPFFDVEMRPSGIVPRPVARRPFQLEEQIAGPVVDLNSFVHRADLVPALGGFDERLERRQDYDLIARYAWLRDPLELDTAYNLYRRIPGIGQITVEKKGDLASPALIAEKIERCYRDGLDVTFPPWVRKISVLSWDMSRNHFAKAYSVAEALSRRVEVELISFRFFEEAFGPLAGRAPEFETRYFGGGDFPGYFDEFARALSAMTGDLTYAVKPRLPSLGLALMDNFHRGTPIMLEANDLETIVSSPSKGDVHVRRALGNIAENSAQARSPHHVSWSQILDPLVDEIPVVFTHNQNLDRHYANRCLYMRNIKNADEYSPETLDRAAIRAELGYGESDRIILFGGLIRRHKGVYELLTLLERLGDSRFKLLFVGSRETPDFRDLMKRDLGPSVKLMPAQSPARMAELNLASDLVLLWLDPAVPASHFQMPYKLTDAMAMGCAIIASPVSDLPRFEDAGALWTVPFGDFDALVARIAEIFRDPEERHARRRRARRMFEREFTYAAAAANVACAAHRFPAERVTYDVSIRFAKAMSAFKRQFAAG